MIFGIRYKNFNNLKKKKIRRGTLSATVRNADDIEILPPIIYYNTLGCGVYNYYYCSGV